MADAGTTRRDVAPAEVIFDAFIADNHAHYGAKAPDGAPQSAASVKAKKGEKGFLSATSVRVYRSVWKSFNRALETKFQKPWHEATEGEVQDILDKMDGKGRKGEPTPRRSGVSRQRYETVLHRIYGFAFSVRYVDNSKLQGLTNPVPSITNPEEFPGRERIDSLVLQPAYRLMLLKEINVNASGTKARTNAILALMAAEALTPAEIREIRCEDLVWAVDAAPPAAWWATQMERWPEAPEPCALVVRTTGVAQRQAQQRTLTLQSGTRSALRSWLEWRAPHVPAGRQLDGVLFCGQRGKMANSTLYEVAKQHIKETLIGTPQSPGVLEHLVHMGPMALRSAAIMEWLETKNADVVDVMTRAGLVSPRSLRRFMVMASNTTREKINDAVLNEQQERKTQKADKAAGQIAQAA